MANNLLKCLAAVGLMLVSPFNSAQLLSATKGSTTDDEDAVLKAVQEAIPPHYEIPAGPWGLDSTGALMLRNENSWLKASGPSLVQVSASPEGEAWGVGSNGDIWWRDPARGEWLQVKGNMKQVAVGSRGGEPNVWGLNAQGDIFRYQNGSWQQVPGNLSQVSAGASGSVWGVNSAGQIWRWNGNGAWEQIAGGLVQVSAGAPDHVWGVNSAGQIWRWNGSAWDQISGGLKQISVGASGDVWGVNDAGQIWQRSNDTWVQVEGSLTLIELL